MNILETIKEKSMIHSQIKQLKKQRKEKETKLETLVLQYVSMKKQVKLMKAKGLSSEEKKNILSEKSYKKVIKLIYKTNKEIELLNETIKDLKKC